MKKYVLFATAAALIVGTGLVHGGLTNRWRTAPALTALAAQLSTLPSTLGEWNLANTAELPPREKAMTGAVGYLSRVYTNTRKGQSVSILVLSGLPGQISTHTPDVCYPGAGYTLGDTQQFTRRFGEPAQVAEMQTAMANRTGANPSFLRLFWGWRSSKGWTSPENARWEFAAEPMLTKLYVIRETGGVNVPPEQDPANEFLSLLLPQLDSIVAQASSAPPAADAPK